MSPKFYQAHHYNTYYFANIVSNVLESPGVFLRNLEGFCGDLSTQYFFATFPRWSALHGFIEYIVDSLFMEPDEELSVEDAFRSHELEFTGYDEWKRDINPDIEYEDWLREMVLTEPYLELLRTITNEVFSVLFSNRRLLRDLNQLIAHHILDCTITEAKYLNLSDGKNRVKRQTIPEWAARAVFYRDRGRCCNCRADLTGLLSPQFEKHMDHIIPLAKGGINDVTNLQVLCSRCNLAKGPLTGHVSFFYESWYDDLMEEET